MAVYRRIFLLMLTLLVLVSSTGVAVGMHLCGGKLQDLTFFGAAADCPMEEKQELPACHQVPHANDADEDNCCDDQTIVLATGDQAANPKAVIKASAQDLTFAATLFVALGQLFFSEPAAEPGYLAYASPPVVRDIPVFVQSFLL